VMGAEEGGGVGTWGEDFLFGGWGGCAGEGLMGGIVIQ
jgi:hypothetical protein